LTCSAASRRRLAAAAGALLALSCLACAGTAPSRQVADLTNPFLGPEYSAWAIGAVSRLASEEEIRAFLALQDDAAARDFVEQFWQRRDPAPDRPGNPIREAFEERSAQADRLYAEAGYGGSRTARGAVYVLYGPPKDVEFEVSPFPAEPPIELWTYGPDAPAGLDGRRPSVAYRFVKRGELTVPYVPRATRRRR
jgi:GWxTD domain-containing protein